MSSRFSYTSNFTRVIIIVEFLLVSYLFYSLTKNVYNSYQVDRVIESFEAKNALIEEENRRKNEDYLYSTSEEYIDRIAKQDLGLINNGEEIIVLASDGVKDSDGNGAETNENVSRRTRLSNPEQWWNFFFGN